MKYGKEAHNGTCSHEHVRKDDIFDALYPRPWQNYPRPGMTGW